MLITMVTLLIKENQKVTSISVGNDLHVSDYTHHWDDIHFFHLSKNNQEDTTHAQKSIQSTT